MNHQFNINIAKEYGIEEAIIINNLDFWLSHNKANGKNYKDGTHWTFNSARAFAELFPYMSAAKIRRVLIRLEDRGVIVTGTFNKIGYDRTKWYSFTEEFCKKNKSILQFCRMEVTEMENGCSENVTPIPDIKPDEKQHSKLRLEKPKKSTPFKPPTPDEVSDYCEERKNKIDAGKFCDYYESKGWMIGSSKMKSWQAAIRNWERNNKEKTTTSPTKSTLQFDSATTDFLNRTV